MENIQIVPNVLSKEQCENLISEYNPDLVVQAPVYFDSNTDEYSFNGMRRSRCAGAPLIKTICNNWNFELEGASVLKYEIGAENPYHLDNSNIDNSGNVTQIKPWQRTAIIFLNDNFNGGVLVYPNQQFTIKPTAGLMLIAPAGAKFPHFVTKVLENSRFVLVIRILN